MNAAPPSPDSPAPSDPRDEPATPPPFELAAGTWRSALVVTNPTAGRRRGVRAAAELAEGLRRRGTRAQIFETTARGDALARLRTLDPDTELVVAVGGDGTLREVLDGLTDPEIPVGLLPYGRANHLARALGCPRDVHHALEILERRHTTRIDVSRANGHLCALSVDVGFPAMVRQEKEQLRRPGGLAILEALVNTIHDYRPPCLRVELDGTVLRDGAGHVLVSNLAGPAGLRPPLGYARIDDGLLEVFLFPTGHLRELAAFSLRNLLRRPGGPVVRQRARRVRISSETPVPYRVDGELGGTTPLEIEIAPNRYRLIVP